MSVSTRKLVYDFRRHYDSINSGKTKDIDLVDVIAYLNEAQEIWYENRVFVAQTNQKVRNDLRVWKRDAVETSCSNYSDGICFVKYPDNLYHRLNQLAIATKDCCTNMNKEIIPRIVQSDDLHEARHNPLHKADYFFEQLLAIESSNGLLLYHDNEMKIKKVLFDYYIKPKELHAPSLEECEGPYYYDYFGRIVDKDQDFEGGDTYSANDIVEIAVFKASRDVSDIQGFQTQLNTILQRQTFNK